MFWLKILNEAFIIGLLASSIRVAMPLLMAGLGEIFAERSGVLNVGIEGLMLIGALCGFLGSYFTQNPWLGALVGMLAAGLVGLIHAWLSISLGADQVVSGIALNILALGLATFLNRAVFGVYTSPPQAVGFSIISVPGLSEIPFLGPVLFQHHALVFIGLLLVPITAVILFQTTWGLKITAVGEKPRAAETAGINVHVVRYVCVLIGALLAGLAGTTLSLGQLNMFKETMIAGRGFIAIAVVMFGRWNPYGALGAALLFGLAEAAQIRFQALGMQTIPPQLLSGLPYLVTLIVVIKGIGHTAAPKALCVPYLRQD